MNTKSIRTAVASALAVLSLLGGAVAATQISPAQASSVVADRQWCC